MQTGPPNKSKCIWSKGEPSFETVGDIWRVLSILDTNVGGERRQLARPLWRTETTGINRASGPSLRMNAITFASLTHLSQEHFYLPAPGSASCTTAQRQSRVRAHPDRRRHLLHARSDG